MSGSTVTAPHQPSCAPSRAARELGLKRSEFDLAVHLGHIWTVPDEGGGGRRVTRSEIDRLRTEDGFPDALQERVRVVGTTEGAAVMDVPVSRFTRLARLGVVAPVRFYLNRYRAVVWLYLAEELRQFAADEENSPLLNARRTPEGMRDLLDAGLDLRARNWRGRHREFLLRVADGPWESAGALAAFLDPVQISEIVPDPYERSHLMRFRPGPPAQGAQGSPAAYLAERIMTADDPDEISRLRADLTGTLEDARRLRPAPRPAAKQVPPEPEQRSTACEQSSAAPAVPEQPSRGLLGWLRRRSA
ncbi:DUF6397 family protein [Streptomyces sp. NBC_00124]|uniref:DUF6397 family protein n=1 Tax=Streptomyces sp. NBC_00124 TaxID=2975662 RepID=UPI0022527030|nr:DUF6397 family protein [Streptomyces sp. NBC_00124]MCX5365502.1 DUF6397 family protein [Streptomyces sp. NBC_00124]